MNRWKKRLPTSPVHLMNGAETLCGIPMLGNNYAIENEEVTCEKCLEISQENINQVNTGKIDNRTNFMDSNT